ncbi:MAG: ABC transporter substrate-binding protein [Nocardioides sp.]
MYQLRPRFRRTGSGRTGRGSLGTVPLAFAVLLTAACGAESPQRESAEAERADRFPLTVDSCGDAVEITDEPTQILTVGTTAVNTLAALGKADLIVARAGEFGSPLTGEAAEAADDVPVITDEDPTQEQIIGSGADLVIGYGLFNADADDLAAAGVQSLVTAGDCGHDGAAELPTGFDAVKTDLENLGTLLGATETAADVRVGMDERLRSVREQVSGEEPTTAAAVYFFADALSVNGNRSFVHAQLEQIGVTNVFADLDESFVEGNREELIASDPDVIVLSYGFAGETFEKAKAQFLQVPGVDRMRAVAAGRIVGIPTDLRDPDPSAVEGVELLAGEIFGSG